MFKKFIVQLGDKHFARTMNRLRYAYHVQLKGNMVYPKILEPLFLSIESENLVAIDVGANVGIFSNFLSRNFKSCLSIEPMPSLANALRTSAILNMTVFENAAGAKTQKINISVPVSKTGSLMYALSTASPSNKLDTFERAEILCINVEQDTIDNLASEQGKIGFIKIDVEGYENAVLVGSTEIIERDNPIFFIEIFPNYNSQYRFAFDFLTRRNYSAYRLTSLGLQILNEKDVEKIEADYRFWDGLSSMDYLFLPENFVQTKKSLIVELTV